MTALPNAVLSDRLAELIRGRRLIAAVFTTYQFDGGFFEQEVLPVLFDLSLSHVGALRLMQLERPLRDVPSGVAVFYDAGGLLAESDYPSPKLGFRRVPVRIANGYVYHPKNVFLLVEAPGEGDEPAVRSLIVGALSANLTRNGWWSNVEAAHFEEIEAGARTRLKADVRTAIRFLRNQTESLDDRRPLEALLEFLKEAEQREHRTASGALEPHFYPGQEHFVDWLADATRGRLDGLCLEVVSPYFDGAERCDPLEALRGRFDLDEVRVYLPRDEAGQALCDQRLFDSVRKLPGVSWGRFAKDPFFRLGRADTASERFIHAKVYRFFSRKRKKEYLFVGSVNLTTAAHLGRNVESGFLVQAEPPAIPDFWLTKERELPKAFAPPAASQEENPDRVGGTPLELRFHWDTGELAAFWDAAEPSSALLLQGRSIALGAIGPLKPKAWTKVPAEVAAALREVLPESSLVFVKREGHPAGVLLVQEEGLVAKPSLLRTLSVGEILRYWALLSPEQRAAFIEVRAGELAATGDGAALVARYRQEALTDTLFDRFAGWFHAFSALERAVDDAVEEGNLALAATSLFGSSFDSLPTLLERLLAPDATQDDVDKYVILLCAEQLIREVRRRHPDLWKNYAALAKVLETRLVAGEAVEARLRSRDGDMARFLDWYRGWFIKRARPVEVEP